MRKTAKAMALFTAASMIMTAFTPVYAESTDTEDTAAVDWENGKTFEFEWKAAEGILHLL